MIGLYKVFWFISVSCLLAYVGLGLAGGSWLAEGGIDGFNSVASHSLDQSM